MKTNMMGIICLMTLLCPLSSHPQSVRIDWFAFGNGGGVSTSSSLSINSVIGQTFTGGANQSNIALESGFFADTLLRGSMLAVREKMGLPEVFSLMQNYPNPFNPVTTIRYELPTKTLVILKVFNILGQEIGTLVNELKPAGKYDVRLSAANLPSGVYFYRIQADRFVQTKKLVVLR